MFFRRRMCGLCLFTFGLGMFIGLLMSGAAVLIAALLLILGFWLLFM